MNNRKLFVTVLAGKPKGKSPADTMSRGHSVRIIYPLRDTYSGCGRTVM